MLEQTFGWLAPVLILAVGLVARALVMVGILMVIAIPVVAALFGWQGLTYLANRAFGVRQVGRLRWREGNYYAPAHLWLRQRGENDFRVGIDDVAQRVLPDIQTVGLRAPGTVVTKGDPIAQIRCGDEIVTLRAPVNGIIEAINEKVVRTPELLHTDPYRRAWLVDMQGNDRSFKDWPFAEGARSWLMDEERRLTALMERQFGIAAADGGELVVPPKEALTPEQWKQIRTSVLERAA